MWRKPEWCDACGKKLAEQGRQYVCAGCQCYMRAPTKKVKRVNMFLNEEAVYCGRCAPPYDEEIGYSFFRMMQCNADGTPFDAKKSK